MSEGRAGERDASGTTGQEFCHVRVGLGVKGDADKGTPSVWGTAGMDTEMLPSQMTFSCCQVLALHDEDTGKEHAWVFWGLSQHPHPFLP